jgi:hypothetical protein
VDTGREREMAQKEKEVRQAAEGTGEELPDETDLWLLLRDKGQSVFGQTI